MNIAEFVRLWPVLKRAVRSLDVPWLDEMAAADRDPFRVLIACILSLRTQDRVTAEASRRLFGVAPSAETLARLAVSRIEKLIYPVGFYRVKAARIRRISAEIRDNYKGRVPDTIEELLAFEGVGRKTANLVVTVGHGKPGICVDTHVHRITNRWGVVETKTPERTEFALRAILPVRYWRELNGLLVAFGQGICKPLSPLCSRCPLTGACDRRGVTRSR